MNGSHSSTTPAADIRAGPTSRSTAGPSSSPDREQVALIRDSDEHDERRAGGDSTDQAVRRIFARRAERFAIAARNGAALRSCPAPTVSLVASSIRMKLPVVRLRR